MKAQRVRVPAVRIAKNVVQSVTFVARKKAVVARTKGQPKIKVTPLVGLGGKVNKFEAISVKKPSVVWMGKTPAQAFARAAKNAWA